MEFILLKHSNHYDEGQRVAKFSVLKRFQLVIDFWGLRDSKGKYEANYMCFSKEQCRFDSTMKLYVPKKEELEKTKSPKYIDDGLFNTGYTKSYAPNNYGLYDMAGNVSEMVNTFDKATMKSTSTGTKGGSWFSCDYFLEIDAENEYPNEINASPLIGFRPVMTALKTK